MNEKVSLRSLRGPELLEDRLAPAAFTVLNASDSSPGSLRAAVQAANATPAPDTITFSPALANQTIRLTSGELTITAPVSITGLGPARLTLHGNDTNRIFNIDDGNTGVTTAVSISGLKLTHGLANEGGAVFNVERLSVSSCAFTDNVATTEGGAIRTRFTSLSVFSSTFTDNRAALGGALSIADGAVSSISNSYFHQNVATGTSFGGGALFMAGAAVTVASSVLTANTANASKGGGLFNFSGTTSVMNSTFSGNTAPLGGTANFGTLNLTGSLLSGNSAPGNGAGGGIHNTGTLNISTSTLAGNSAVNGGAISNIETGSVTVTNTTLSENTADLGGGLVNADTGNVVILGSTFSGNTAPKGAGGAIVNTATLALTNSTLSGNSALARGGALVNSGGTLTATNCTIVSNTVTAGILAAGGGINIIGTGLSLFNTVVAGNVNADGSPSDIGGDNLVATSSFNLIGDPNSAGGLVHGVNGNKLGQFNGTGQVLMPLFEILDPTLRNNGGPTLTHAVIPFSSVIEAGDGTRVTTLPFDQRGPGFPRVAFSHPDIGAVELRPPLFNDSFNRADNVSLGTPWASRVGALGIGGNTARGTAALNLATLANFSMADADLYGTVDLVPGQQAGLVARYAGAGDRNYYLASLTRDASGMVTARIIRNVNGVNTELAVVEGIQDTAGILRFQLAGSTLRLYFREALLASPVDSTFKLGSAGLRTTGTASVDDFAVWFIPTGADVVDVFSRPDNTLLSEQWTNAVGYYRTAGGKAQGGQAINLAVLNGFPLQPDVDVQATAVLTGLGHSAGLVARYQGNGDTNYYLARLMRTATGFTATVLRNVRGVVTPLATSSILSTTGIASMRFLVTGTNLKLFVNALPVANVLDTSLKGGSVGIRSDGYALLDDFRSSAVVTRSPFADTFDQADNSGLGINWTRRTGDFKVMNNMAIGTSPAPAVNLAILADAVQANVDIQAEVSLVTVNNEVGLVARYTGVGDTNYYMARILRTASGFNLSIVKNVGGRVTRLASLNVLALTGRIRFRVVGTSLKLLMNDIEQISAVDSGLTTGSLGIRSVGTGTIDNFAAIGLP